MLFRSAPYAKSKPVMQSTVVLHKHREETKGRFRKRVVLANVPSFRFFVPGEHANVPSFRLRLRGKDSELMYPRSGFSSQSPKAGQNKAGWSDFRNQQFEPDTEKTRNTIGAKIITHTTFIVCELISQIHTYTHQLHNLNCRGINLFNACVSLASACLASMISQKGNYTTIMLGELVSNCTHTSYTSLHSVR